MPEEGGATSRDFSLIYRAPELWDQPILVPTPASDVYSLAVVCYEVCAIHLSVMSRVQGLPSRPALDVIDLTVVCYEMCAPRPHLGI